MMETIQSTSLKQAHQLFECGRWAEARAAYEQVLAHQENPFAHARLGTLLRQAGDLFAGRRHLERASELDPHNATYRAAWGNLCVVTGQLERGLELITEACRQDPGNAEIFSSYLFTAHYRPHLDRVALLRDHCRWGQIHGRPQRRLRPPLVRRGRRRLRIGYLGADFKQHSVGYTVGPLLGAHHRERFEVYGYACVENRDAMSHQLRDAFDKYRLVHRMDDPTLAQQIRSDEIDILVAVGGHSYGNRLTVLAYQPAPLQIDYGGIDTVGLVEVQVRLTDARRDPPASASYFLETLAYLPEGSTCYQPPADAPDVGPLPALRNGRVTFGACHGAQKINDRCLGLWAAVLQAVPQSCLRIKCAGGEVAELRDHLVGGLARHGVDARRVEVEGLWATTSHLAFYRDIDIALDAFPFNGGVTTLEGLWMGVPLISRVGPHTVSRTGLTLLGQIGLERLALEGDEAFVKMARVLADDLTSLAALRRSLRTRMRQSSLCDIDRYVGLMEECLETCWATWSRRWKGGDA